MSVGFDVSFSRYDDDDEDDVEESEQETGDTDDEDGDDVPLLTLQLLMGVHTKNV